MRTYQMAICDDEQYHIDNIMKFMAAFESEADCTMEIRTFLDGTDILGEVESGAYLPQILLLDVDMPGGKGTDIGKQIHEEHPKIVLGFITSYEEYAYEAFRAEALGYLTKPVDYKELRHLLNRCIMQVELQSEKMEDRKKYIEVKNSRSTQIVDVEEILYIEKRRNQCVFHMEDGEFVSYTTLGQVYEALDHKQFLYTHQGYIVNFNQIKEVKTSVVCLGKQREIPVSRKYQIMLRDMHMEKIHAMVSHS